jgi:hypothetical protein
MSPDEARLLAAATLHRAVLDARAGSQEALAWLASHAAAPWLDMLGIPQSYFLLHAGWLQLARCNMPCHKSPLHACVSTSFLYLSRLSCTARQKPTTV